MSFHLGLGTVWAIPLFIINSWLLIGYFEYLKEKLEKVEVKGNVRGFSYYTCGQNHDKRNPDWKPFQHLEAYCKQVRRNPITGSGFILPGFILDTQGKIPYSPTPKKEILVTHYHFILLREQGDRDDFENLGDIRKKIWPHC